MDDPVLAVVKGRKIHRSEVIARHWAARDQIIESAKTLADRIDELADYPANADFRHLVDLLQHAHKQGDAAAFNEALADFLAELARLKEAGVLK